MNSSQYKGGAAGFTMIEVLVAVVVVALGCLAVLSFHSSAIRSGSQADTLTVASFLGESQIERLRSIQFNGIESSLENARGNSNTACFSGSVNPCDAAVSDKFKGCTLCYSECLNRAGGECTSDSQRGCFKRSTGIIANMPTTRSHTVLVTVEWRGPDKDHLVEYNTMISAFGFSGD